MSTLDELATALNSIRNEFRAIPVLCIPWMHLKHPAHPVQEMLLRGEAAVNTKGDMLPASLGARIAHRVAHSPSLALRAAFCLANSVRLAFKLLLLRQAVRTSVARLLDQSFAIIAKTWCFGPSPSPATESDFYYGDLQKRLQTHGVKMLLLCGDANNSDWNTFASRCISVEGNPRIPELALCRPLSPLKIAWQQVKTSLALRRRFRSAAGALLQSAMAQASLDCLNPAVTQDSLYFEIAQTAVRQWKPQAFVTLYEGHGWEKAAWWGAKTEQKSCRTVGYQHTALFSESLSMLRPCIDDRARSLPDVVLALGEQTANLLDAGHRAHGTKLIHFGTFRRQSGATAVQPANPSLRTALVLPEGMAAEADALFRFAYECARHMPEYRFILRGHPQWPAERALRLIDSPVLSMRNIEVSTNASIYDDFNRSSLLLYRGSSAALYGILSGLLAVNLRLPQMINSDPIYQLSVWREICSSPAELRECVARFERKPEENRLADWRVAADYINRYIVPVDDKSVMAFLDAIEISRADLCTA